MKTLKRIQILPVGIDEAWRFFSCPANLKDITPAYMGFDITSGYQGEEMYEGMIISYKVRPLFNISVNWVTEITRVIKPEFFVDSQKSGPFKYWHHQHLFKKHKQGVEMTDIVNYALPMRLISWPVEGTIVKKRVDEIFDYRFAKLNEIFRTGKGQKKSPA